MIRIFCILSFLLLPPYLFSEEKKYGSLIYNTDIPNTLFLMGNIRNGDSFYQSSGGTVVAHYP